MFQIILVAFGVFTATVSRVSAQTATFTYTTQASDCTGGFVCTISASTVDAVIKETNGKLEFLKGGSTAFQITWDGSAYVLQDGAASPNTITGFTYTGDGTLAFTMTFPAAFPLTSAQAGDWTCKITSDSSNYAVTTAITIANTDLGVCGTTISMDPCAKTMTCDLGQSVADVITNSGTINFKKGGTIMYKIAATDTVTDNAASPAAVTGLTAAAPVGTTAGGDANDATLTFGTTFVTFDSTTLDGDWICDVSGTSNAWFALASASTTLSTSCVATISVDACARTMSCTFPKDVDTLQTDSGVISFKKAGTTQFQIASADDAVTSDGTTGVTGVTATAPVGTSTTDAKIARLTFAATATFDSTLVDGAWTCEVDAATASNDIVSVSTTLSATCGAVMNKVAGLVVVLMVTMKALLF